jgi:pyruvate,water dikinase
MYKKVKNTMNSRSRDESHWKWRALAARRIAEWLDAEHYGVAALYLFGSVKNATAGPCSDIDLIIHFRGSDDQRRRLEYRLARWDRLLADINRSRTGYLTETLLDVHVVTDDDIDARTSYASKIGAVTDGARALSLGRRPD